MTITRACSKSPGSIKKPESEGNSVACPERRIAAADWLIKLATRHEIFTSELADYQTEPESEVSYRAPLDSRGTYDRDLHLKCGFSRRYFAGKGFATEMRPLLKQSGQIPAYQA